MSYQARLRFTFAAFNYDYDVLCGYTEIARHYLPQDFTLSTWEALEPFFKELLERPINSKAELEQWLQDSSEVEAAISEDACWRQIKMTCDTENKTLEDAFTFFVMEIQPKIQPYADALNKKLVNNPHLAELDQTLYHTYLRSVRKSIELFREENIPLQASWVCCNSSLAKSPAA